MAKKPSCGRSSWDSSFSWPFAARQAPWREYLSVTESDETRFQRALAAAARDEASDGWAWPAGQEETLLESGQVLKHHRVEDCSGNCCLHGTSPHPSCRLPRQWRKDTGALEHQCSHGVGHPCLAGAEYAEAISGGEESRDSVHRCDGCCMKAAEAALTTPVFSLPSLYAQLVTQQRKLEDLQKAMEVQRDGLESGLEAGLDRHSNAIDKLKREVGFALIGVTVVASLILILSFVLLDIM